MDIAILSDKNISSKEFNKLIKYMHLETEIARMNHLNTSTIPILKGELRIIKMNINIDITKTPEKSFTL